MCPVLVDALPEFLVAVLGVAAVVGFAVVARAVGAV